MPFRRFRDPVSSLRALQNDIGHAIERVWDEAVPGEWTGPFRMPPIDIYDHADRYVIYAELPGLRGDDIDVTILECTLTLRGEKKAPVAEDAAAGALRTERRYGTFSRSIELPKDIDPESISANCQHGVLTVTVAKCSANEGTSVKVNVASG